MYEGLVILSGRIAGRLDLVFQALCEQAKLMVTYVIWGYRLAISS